MHCAYAYTQSEHKYIHSTKVDEFHRQNVFVLDVYVCLFAFIMQKSWHFSLWLKADLHRISNRLFLFLAQNKEKTHRENSYTKYKLNWWCVKNVDTIMSTCTLSVSDDARIKQHLKVQWRTHTKCTHFSMRLNTKQMRYYYFLKKMWPVKVFVHHQHKSIGFLCDVSAFIFVHTFEHFELSLFSILYCCVMQYATNAINEFNDR